MTHQAVVLVFQVVVFSFFLLLILKWMLDSNEAQRIEEEERRKIDPNYYPRLIAGDLLEIFSTYNLSKDYTSIDVLRVLAWLILALSTVMSILLLNLDPIQSNVNVNRTSWELVLRLGGWFAALNCFLGGVVLSTCLLVAARTAANIQALRERLAPPESKLTETK